MLGICVHQNSIILLLLLLLLLQSCIFIFVLRERFADMETELKTKDVNHVILTEESDMVMIEDSRLPKIPELRSTFFIFRLFEEHYPPGFLKKVVAEIIATFLLVFVTCGSAALSTSDEHRVSKLGASVAGGLIVTVMIYAVGHVSGAHMNPAVTLAFAAVRHFPWNQVPFYAAAQLTGAVGASFTLHELLHPIKNLGTTSPSGTDLQALVMEIVVTFSMMFVTSAVATDTKAVGELAGIAVGSAVCITSILAGPVSGGSMNPVRTIGPAIASKHYNGIWVYLVGPVLGTLMGAWSYNMIRVSDKPVLHEISSTSSLSSSSFKIRRLQSHGDGDGDGDGDEQQQHISTATINKDPFDAL